MNPGFGEGDAPYGASAERWNMSTSRKGSVKAARERLQVAQNNQRQGMLSAGRSQGTYPAPNQLVSQFQARPRNDHAPMTSSLGMSNVQPHPQWTLEEDSHDQYVHGQQAQRKEPPPRPPRPSYVPSILDPTHYTTASTYGQPLHDSMQTPIEPYQAQPQYYEYGHSDPQPDWSPEHYLSPNYHSHRNSDRPMTLMSQSTASSLGEIPDFPIVPNPHQQKKSPLVGPPPSARRGPSSYYSQMSFVSPIVEESEGTKSHNSFASSNVFSPEQHASYDDGERSVTDDKDLEKDPNYALAGAGPQGSNRGPVRKASLGRREKPMLTTIRSGDTLRDEAVEQGISSKTKGAIAQAAVAAGAAGGAFAAGFGSRHGSKSNSRVNSPGGSRSELSSGTGLLEDSSSDSESLISPIQGVAAGRPNISRSRSPLAISVLDSDSDAPTGRGQSSNRPIRQASFADRARTRRPPKLNMDAVRDAEARGSLTSLPDLIRRATRLAANLDRGKTASRLGLDVFADGTYNGHHRGSGSLSDMLASFPPPALGTPDQGSFSRERGSRWPPRHFDQISTYHDEKSPDRKKQGRRCCGMPLWVFIVVMLILFLLIAAAVVVPVVLIVLPRQRDSSQASVASQCNTSFSCSNNGVVITTPQGSCSCLCKDGFTGERCTTASDASCTTMSIPGVDSATLGNVIPRLLNDANQNFSIPLDAAQVVAQLNAADLSCRAENSLVNFGTGSSRRRSLDYISQPILPRQESSAASTAVPTSTPSATPTPSSTSTPKPTPSGADSVTYTLDFARVSVLFILQISTSVDTASEAQSSIKDALSNVPRETLNHISVKNFTINLADYHITVPNGTTYGNQ
ncbi:hypothetical protein EJ05DRAFT_476731 [Pseudovirgaria hyperparasitica]|uniref:EGF-like domain-containing protein n=1 Tax=Pseudovirgaria hyperparasitica TaxID=470096 RepID=A0A6A6W5N0_9PEZI|nr:uncharacterized protein EJ05DRAFT_476731 [Pseudovirgaria hyperparasitica]KAF2757479.1 hypothetical protein EJ05DRAFT_476731 [Pseudovirgaria hyperparasitica]